VLPALADVGAVRLLTDGVEVQLAHELLEPKILRTAGSANLEPARLALRQGFDAVTPGDLVKSLAHVEALMAGEAVTDRRQGQRHDKACEPRNLPATFGRGKRRITLKKYVIRLRVL
jgi:hypothetical protein